MPEIVSTSYCLPQARELLSSIVRTINPKTVLEIGTQQGSSAILIGSAMSEGSRMWTYDLFEETYSAPPHGATLSSMENAVANIKAANLPCAVSVRKGDATKALSEVMCDFDLVHIDICNHQENVRPILDLLLDNKRVIKYILLEGGIKNRWQERFGFLSYKRCLYGYTGWDNVTFQFNDHYALTVMAKGL